MLPFTKPMKFYKCNFYEFIWLFTIVTFQLFNFVNLTAVHVCVYLFFLLSKTYGTVINGSVPSTERD